MLALRENGHSLILSTLTASASKPAPAVSRTSPGSLQPGLAAVCLRGAIRGRSPASGGSCRVGRSHPARLAPGGRACLAARLPARATCFWQSALDRLQGG